MGDETTLIQVRKKTAAMLKQLWQHGDDTYDSVINKLATEAAKNNEFIAEKIKQVNASSHNRKRASQVGVGRK